MVYHRANNRCGKSVIISFSPLRCRAGADFFYPPSFFIPSFFMYPSLNVDDYYIGVLGEVTVVCELAVPANEAQLTESFNSFAQLSATDAPLLQLII